MWNIDIAQIRDFKKLLQNVITSTSFYLTKKGYLPKSPKSELAQVLKTYVPEVFEVSGAEIPSSLIIDFIAYCRKLPSRKHLLKTYGDLVIHLSATFQRLSLSSERTDIVFDLYLDRSIKECELKRRSQDGVV